MGPEPPGLPYVTPPVPVPVILPSSRPPGSMLWFFCGSPGRFWEEFPSTAADRISNFIQTPQKYVDARARVRRCMRRGRVGSPFSLSSCQWVRHPVGGCEGCHGDKRPHVLRARIRSKEFIVLALSRLHPPLPFWPRSRPPSPDENKLLV